MDSILTSIKKLLGIEENYTQFDDDILIYINSAFLTLNQLGVGTDPIVIKGGNETWSDIAASTGKASEYLKSYIYLRVRLIFDPPQTGFLLDAIKNQITEYEWRINVLSEGG